ncbi:hypothetical protein AGMMS49940_05560 [Spirochaetia bacterium]|nr:hypothetical protein AGMMS49940_05560 [Spirochaetia bacterium]
MKKIIFSVIVLSLLSSSVFADGNAAIIRQLIKQCENSLGVSIRINQLDDYRSVRRQAELMANMTSQQLDWYGSGTWYVIEMKKSTLRGSQRIDEFERLIKSALDQGSFVSRHLKGDAVDIAPSSDNVKNWLKNNSISVKDETVDGMRCWHLQLE